MSPNEIANAIMAANEPNTTLEFQAGTVRLPILDGREDCDGKTVKLPAKTKRLCQQWAKEEFGILPKFESIPTDTLTDFLYS